MNNNTEEKTGEETSNLSIVNLKYGLDKKKKYFIWTFCVFNCFEKMGEGNHFIHLKNSTSYVYAHPFTVTLKID